MSRARVPGEVTSEFRMAATNMHGGTWLVWIGLIVAVGPQLAELVADLGAPGGVVTAVGGVISMAGVALRYLSQGVYTRSRTELKREDLKSQRTGGRDVEGE